jgi:hypothetical protein
MSAFPPRHSLCLHIEKGKTVLCSKLISFLKEDDQTTVLYYFCNNYRSNEVKDLIAILRFFCAQLLQAHPDLTAYFYDEYLGKGANPSIPTLLKALPLALSSIDTVRIVVDGLDEWDSKSVKKTITDLMPLVFSHTPGVSHRLIFSSRDIPQISHKLFKELTISLSDEKPVIDSAMRAYIHARITDIGDQFQGRVNKVVLDIIEDRLVENADGEYSLLKYSACSLPFFCP